MNELPSASAQCELRPDSHVLFLLEAPGSQEMYERKPVVGPAGNVLWQCATEAKLFRPQVSLLNLFPIQVGKEKQQGCITLRGERVFSPRGFTPAGEEHAEFAREVIRQIRPNVVVACGVPALSALYPDWRLQKLRGSLLWSDRIGCKILPTVHPSFILHGNSIYRHVLCADLKKGKREATSPTLTRFERTLHLNPSSADAIAFLREARAQRECATDIENLGPMMDCFSVALNPREAMCFPLFPAIWGDSEQVRVLRAYAELIGDPSVTKINHNILYDLWFLYHQYGIIPAGPIFDTMIAFSVMYPTMTRETSGAAFNAAGSPAGSKDEETDGFPKALHFVTSLYSEEPYYKDEGKVVTRPDGSSDYEGRHRYNALDSAVAYECAEPLAEELDARGYRTSHDMTVAQMASAIAIQHAGFRVDLAALAAARDKALARMSELQREIEELIGHKINLASPAQLCRHFYGGHPSFDGGMGEGRGVSPYLSKDGRPTTDEKALMRIRRRDNLPECDLIAEWRNLATLKKMFFEIKLSADDRFPCSVDLRGSRFGRCSTSKTVFGTGGSIQNLDPRFRSFLIAD